MILQSRFFRSLVFVSMAFTMGAWQENPDVANAPVPCVPEEGCITEGQVEPEAVVRVIMNSRRRFSPANLQIRVGDTVTWVNRSRTIHTVTADPSRARNPANVVLPPGAAPFHSGSIRARRSFSFTFTVPGEYKYICTRHEDKGMIGTITVLP